MGEGSINTKFPKNYMMGEGGRGAGVVTMSRGGGGVVTWCMVTQLPPTGVGQTDACENITFARYATWAVKIYII